MSREIGACALDAAATSAAAALTRSGLRAPNALLFPATGASGLIRALESATEVALDAVPDVPRSWHAVRLHAGLMGDTSVWVIEDAPEVDEVAPAWVRSFPIWMAAVAGAQLLVVTSAGTALRRADSAPAEVGTILRLSDHINLSGSTPLLGLGESRLGPLFPDQTRAHDRSLARMAGEVARGRDITLAPAIAACTIGPALATQAELAWCASAGAEIAVQRLAGPLIAAAHAGLATLVLTAVADIAGEPIDMAELVQRAARTAPTLDGLVIAVAERLGAHARALAEVDEA